MLHAAVANHSVILAMDWPESSNKDVFKLRYANLWIPRSSRGMTRGLRDDGIKLWIKGLQISFKEYKIIKWACSSAG
jgi:hypothetical protein